MKGFCKEAEYMDILEKLVRGKCMKESSEFTVEFAKNFQLAMYEAGCLGPSFEIIIDKM